MKQVGVKRLAVDELLSCGNNYLIPADAEIGIVTLHLLNGANPKIVLNHSVNGFKGELFSFLLELLGRVGIFEFFP